MAFIALKEVTVAFEGVPVLENVNLEVSAGDYLVILGENGSGKSTLIRTILGLVRPQSGSVVYGDGLRRNQIGYLPQHTEAQRDFPASVEEVVLSGCVNQLGHRLTFKADQRARAEEKMAMLDILDKRRQSFRTLSGGQQQRVLLARALCAANAVLLLDEPVTGLDPDAAEEMYAIIRKLNRTHGMTIVMVSHDLQGAIRDANRVMVVNRGIEFLGDAKAYFQYTEGQVRA